jgi:hypothetical protein
LEKIEKGIMLGIFSIRFPIASMQSSFMRGGICAGTINVLWDEKMWYKKEGLLLLESDFKK